MAWVYIAQDIVSAVKVGMALQSPERRVSATHSTRSQRAASLARAYAAGDRAAGDRLLLENDKAIRSFAKKSSPRHFRLLEDDIMQEARLGCLRAAEKYDWALGYSFWTYAKWWIRQHITRWLQNCGHLVRVPVHRQTNGERAGRIVDIEATELADPMALSDRGETAEELEEKIFADDCKIVADAALAEAKPRDAAILRWRFYVDPPATLEEIGQEYGLTRERIRQIEASTMAGVRQFTARLGAPPQFAPTFEDWVDKSATLIRRHSARKAA